MSSRRRNAAEADEETQVGQQPLGNRFSLFVRTFNALAKARPWLVTCLLVIISLCVLAVVITVPVCLGPGCDLKRESQGAPEVPVFRFAADFTAIEATVKSKVPSALWPYFEEVKLLSGISVVSFNDSQVLKEVQKILLANSTADLLNLLLDTPRYAPPTADFFSNLTRNASLTLSRRALETAAAGTGASAAPGGAAGTATGAGSLAARRSTQDSGAGGDPYFGQQWATVNTNARDAWRVTQGNLRVIVAVIDTGCDLTHPDLKEHLWKNPGEVEGNGKDDDYNGYVDDVHGYDFAGPCESNFRDGTGCGPQSDPTDRHGHGTHCAGIIGAVRNNGVGVVGIAPNVSIMCLKVTPLNGRFYNALIFQALDYAYKMGAHIVSCSFGPDGPNLSPSLEDKRNMTSENDLYYKQLSNMTAKGMLIVAAAGNEDQDLDLVLAANATYNPCFAAQAFPNHTLCVAATNEQDGLYREVVSNKQISTNYGANTVDVGAPGRLVLSTVPDSQWANMSGSSMATPMTAGIGALVISVLGMKDGNFFKGAEARKMITERIKDVPGLRGKVRYGGRVDAFDAVNGALGQLSGYIALTPLKDFAPSEQSVLAPGFSEAYYAGAVTQQSQEDNGVLLDVGTRAGDSSFDTYKQGSGTTLVLRAYLNLPTAGLYRMKVTTDATTRQLDVTVGQRALPSFSTVHLINSTGGWYSFVLRYRNPSRAIDITLGEPDSGDLTHLPLFYIATTAKARSYYHAPQITLSSAFQVLTRAVKIPAPATTSTSNKSSSSSTAPAAGGVTPASILESALPLDLSAYNHSAVLDDVDFTVPGALRSALYPPDEVPAGEVPRAVVGLVHTRLRAPEVPMQFKVTCHRCALYVNSLCVLDMYHPAGLEAATTQLSACVSFGPTGQGTGAGDATMYDLLLRFGANDSSTALLRLHWLPCDAAAATGPSSSLRSHTANNLFWRPSSGVAGYVSGFQCDAWEDKLGRDASEYPLPGPPLLKFRLPAALTQTYNGAKGLLAQDAARYSALTSSGCSANESAASNCTAAAAVALKDVLATTGDAGVLQVLYVRCWAYINSGFRPGFMQLATSDGCDTFAFLGAQTVYKSTAANAKPSWHTVPFAPNRTVLNGSYQLIAMEYRGVASVATLGIINGTAEPDFMQFGMQDALLPIPVLPDPDLKSAAGVPSPPTPPQPGLLSTPQPSPPVTNPSPPTLPQPVPPSAPRPKPPSPSPGPPASPQPGLPSPPQRNPPPSSPSPPAQPQPGWPSPLRPNPPSPSLSSLLPPQRGPPLPPQPKPLPLGPSPPALLQPGLPPPPQPGTPPPALSVSARRLLQLGGSADGWDMAAQGGSAYSLSQVPQSSGLLADVYTQDSDSSYSLPGLVLNTIPSDGSRLVATRSSGVVGLDGSLGGPSANGSRYVRAAGFLRLRAPAPGLTPWALRVRDGRDQSVAVVMGDVTVRNAVEFPAESVTETETVMVLPAGYIPTVVMVRSSRTDTLAQFDVALVDALTRNEINVSKDLWYGVADGNGTSQGAG